MQFRTGFSSDPLARYAAAKLAVVEAEQELDEAKHLVIEHLQSKKTKSLTRVDGNRKQIFTIARQTRTVVDEQGLSAALDPEIFDSLLKKQLDKKKLEAALEEGRVDPDVVAPHLDLKEGDPFVVFTETEVEPDAP